MLSNNPSTVSFLYYDLAALRPSCEGWWAPFDDASDKFSRPERGIENNSPRLEHQDREAPVLVQGSDPGSDLDTIL